MKEMLVIAGTLVEPGDVREIHFPLTEAANSRPVLVPITVMRGLKEGPCMLLTAAVHGDELNGTAVLRELLGRIKISRLRGALIIVPIVNILGFLARSRYLPDRRDLNRYFPGNPRGNIAQRIAHRFFESIVRLADVAVDLHTAAEGRINFPHIRANMRNPDVRKLARSFGSPVIIDHPGRPGTLRRAATESGIPSLLYEGGTANLFERRIVRTGLHGIEDLLVRYGMLRKKAIDRRHPFQIILKTTTWVRAERGGILELKTHPGALIYRGEPIATISNPIGRDVHVLPSPVTGIVIGVSTSPVTNPGSPILHIGELRKTLGTVERAISAGKFRPPRLHH